MQRATLQCLVDANTDIVDELQITDDDFQGDNPTLHLDESRRTDLDLVPLLGHTPRIRLVALLKTSVTLCEASAMAIHLSRPPRETIEGFSESKMHWRSLNLHR